MTAISSGDREYCRHGNAIHPNPSGPTPFIWGFVKKYGDTVFRLDKYLNIIEVYGIMMFPVEELIGEKMDTFIAHPEIAANFRINASSVRIFGGCISMIIPFKYETTMITCYLRIKRYGDRKT